MKKRIILIPIGMGAIAVLFMLISYWLKTQPIRIVDQKLEVRVAAQLPSMNRKIINFIELHGSEISPTYEAAVCTEFIIQVIDHFQPLSKEERKLIRIITNEDLPQLVEKDADVIKGVQTALLHKNKGVMIDLKDVLPGDFVQFWDVYYNSAYGHCGVVMEINPNKSLTLYSSHPLTNGYGKQTFLWPNKIYFARLNQ
jgi:hypothetical protein